MSDLTYEEKLKLEDSKEHLQIVLGNIRDANKQLSSLLDLIVSFHKEISGLSELKEKISKEIIDSQLEFDNKKAEQNRRELSLITRENDFSTRESNIMYEISRSEDKLRSIERSINLSKKDYEYQIISYCQEIDGLKKKSDNLIIDITNHEETKKYQLRDKKILEGEINRLTLDKERKEKELIDFKKKSAIEINNIHNLIETEKDKIRKPLELLGIEDFKLEKKRKNFEIIQARLTTQFRKQNPDKMLPLELQHE